MKKYEIIKKNTEFSNIINNKSNNVLRNKYYSIYYKPNNLLFNKYGITVPTKTGKAVVRNKLKRQVKDIIDKNTIPKAYDYVIILRKAILEITYLEKKQQLLDLLAKIGETNEN